jgi:hypothetical protein
MQTLGLDWIEAVFSRERLQLEACNAKSCLLIATPSQLLPEKYTVPQMFALFLAAQIPATNAIRRDAELRAHTTTFLYPLRPSLGVSKKQR